MSAQATQQVDAPDASVPTVEARPLAKTSLYWPMLCGRKTTRGIVRPTANMNVAVSNVLGVSASLKC